MKKLRRMTYTKWFTVLKNGLIKNNPVFAAGLGICSALAITNKVENAIAMGLGVTFVTMASSMTTSAIRKFIPSKVRMITYMVIISTFVIAFAQFLEGFFPEISKALGPFVGLIITNCIVMGRAEAFASKSPVKYSALDALANGFGYTYTLIIVAAIREILAFGTILGINVVPAGWTNWVVMAMAPGGFFVMAVLLWVMRELAGLESDAA